MYALMRLSITALIAQHAWLNFDVALAQNPNCGDPPPVANEALRGEIEGEAQFLSRFLGDASLAGQIETSREEIFSKYPNQRERSDAYFEYMICMVIMGDDNTMTPQEKINEIVRVKEQFYGHRSSDAQQGNSSVGNTNVGNVTVEGSTGVIIGNSNTMVTKPGR
jgi:hypothetical protein